MRRGGRCRGVNSRLETPGQTSSAQKRLPPASAEAYAWEMPAQRTAGLCVRVTEPLVTRVMPRPTLCDSSPRSKRRQSGPGWAPDAKSFCGGRRYRLHVVKPATTLSNTALPGFSGAVADDRRSELPDNGPQSGEAVCREDHGVIAPVRPAGCAAGCPGAVRSRQSRSRVGGGAGPLEGGRVESPRWASRGRSPTRRRARARPHGDATPRAGRRHDQRDPAWIGPGTWWRRRRRVTG